MDPLLLSTGEIISGVMHLVLGIRHRSNEGSTVRATKMITGLEYVLHEERLRAGTVLA